MIFMELSEVPNPPLVRWSAGHQDTKHEIDEIIPIDFPISGGTLNQGMKLATEDVYIIYILYVYHIYICMLYISDITII